MIDLGAQAVADLLEDLVTTPSPSGQENNAAQVLVDHLTTWGLDPWIDEVGNVHVARGPEEAPAVLLLGHIDTVPGQPPVRWDDGVLWGRGTVDAKGPLVAHAAALARLEDPQLRVELVAAVGEETDSRGARHLVETHPPPEAVVIAEPTGLDTVGLGYKGCLRGQLIATARPSHPGAGDPTASETLVEAIDALTAWTGNPGRDPGFDQTTLRVTDLSTGIGTDQETARAGIDLRLPGPVPETEKLQACLPTGVELVVEEAVPAVRVSPRDPVATSLRAAMAEEGTRSRQAVKTGTSDWNVIGQAWQTPTAAYGPGDAELDHTPDEHVGLSEVLQGAAILERALGHLPGHLDV